MSSDTANSFGGAFRSEHFQFDPAYRPLNHGSYGAYPLAVRSKQRQLQDLTEGRSDPFIRFAAPPLLKDSRAAAARLCNVDFKNIVFVPNATTGINTVLRNLQFDDGDVILYLNTAYGACEKTILQICQTTHAKCVRVDVIFPIEDDALVEVFRKRIVALQQDGLRVKIAMFDTVVTFPGVRLPWEALVAACRDLGVLSLIDGAHGIGHIDLTHLHMVDPDFFTSNCYKWLFTPRACAVLYVALRNHNLIRTTFPTSHGFIPNPVDGQSPSEDPLGDLFAWAATIDMSPYLCVPAALDFRAKTCGGEKAIRDYCFDLARRGGMRVAEILGTEVMDNSTKTLSQCCFTMVRLPLHFTSYEPGTSEARNGRADGLPIEDGPEIVKNMMHRIMNEFDSWIPGKFYNGAAWMRISSQVYLDMQDFEWAGQTLKQLCEDLLQ